MTEAFNIDCMEAMREMKDNEFDLAIVDPPYGLGSKLTNGGTWASKYSESDSKWDRKPNRKYWTELYRTSRNWIIWGGNNFTDNIPPARCFIVWKKPEMSGMHTMSDSELALTSFDENSRIVEISRGNELRIHITQKPAALYKWLLKNYAKEGDRILDTHLGSGSSRIAAHDMGFDFVGYEIDKDYFDAQELRFQNHIAQQSLFKPEEQY
jgi:site-specific DNA-methyltransferase (adenine-specific)